MNDRKRVEEKKKKQKKTIGKQRKWSRRDFEVEKNIWESRVREDADKKNLGSCNRSQRNIQTVKGKNLFFIQE